MTPSEQKRGYTEPPSNAICKSCHRPFGKGCSAGPSPPGCLCGHFDDCPHYEQVQHCIRHWKSQGYLKPIK